MAAAAPPPSGLSISTDSPPPLPLRAPGAVTDWRHVGVARQNYFKNPRRDRIAVKTKPPVTSSRCPYIPISTVRQRPKRRRKDHTAFANAPDPGVEPRSAGKPGCFVGSAVDSLAERINRASIVRDPACGRIHESTRLGESPRLGHTKFKIRQNLHTELTEFIQILGHVPTGPKHIVLFRYVQNTYLINKKFLDFFWNRSVRL
jgi:hypothetical protein